MSFFGQWLSRLFGGRQASSGSREDPNGLWVYVRCDACGEVIRVRIDREHDLSADFEAGDFPTSFRVSKELIGRNCFRRIHVDMSFDSRRQPVEREARGGTFVTAEEYEAYAATQGGETPST